MDLQQGSYKEYGLIARPRDRKAIRASTGDIMLTILKEIKQYYGFSNVSSKAPNFIIRLSNIQQQRQLLSQQIIEGPNFILDLHPWCPEYETLDLPWIIGSAKQVLPTKDLKIYIDNLLGQPIGLARHIQNIITGLQPPDSATDGFIHLETLPNNSNTVAAPSDTRDQMSHIKGYAASAHTARVSKTESLHDLSYFLIIELKDLYKQKHGIFRECMHNCWEMCDVTRSLAEQLQVQLTALNESYASDSDDLDESESIGFQLSDYSEEICYQSNHLFEQLIYMGSILCPLQNQIGILADLNKFSDKLYSQPNEVHSTVLRFRAILRFIVQKIYGELPTVQVTPVQNNTVQIDISVPDCVQETYQINMSQSEAEIQGIFRFLRSITNDLGYNIIDPNYPVLKRIVSDMNMYNAKINELQICDTISMTSINEVHQTVMDMDRKLQASAQTPTIQKQDVLFKKMLTCVKDHHDVIKRLSSAFEAKKKEFRAMQLCKGILKQCS